MRTALVLMFALGCSSETTTRTEPRPAPEVATPVPNKPAPTGKWSMTGNLLISGAGPKYGVELGVFALAGKLSLHPIKMPIGTVIEIGGQRFETKKELANAFELPLEAALAELPWQQLRPVGKYQLAPKLDLKLTLAITVPGYDTLTTPLPPLIVTTKLEDVYTAMASSDRTWPGAAPTGPIPAAAAWAFNGFEAVGTADKVRDVRFVVTGVRTQNARTRRCSGYIGAGDFTATSYDVDLAIVDRVTKQTVATKKFIGQPACPSTVFTSAGSGPAHNEGPSMKSMRGWLTSQLAKLAK